MAENSRFELQRVQGAPASSAALIDDLRRVAEACGSVRVTQKIYTELGSFDESTVRRRFGTWNQALIAAGLEVSNEINISDERLFENILNLWQHYGRQPRQREAGHSPSQISSGAYRRRFGSWGPALAAFVEYANGEDAAALQHNASVRGSAFVGKRTARDASLRLRFRVLQRDHFRCCACGATPAVTPGVALHVDHVLPWSKGGETIQENLQTLCETCNLGKGDTMPPSQA